MMYIETKKKHIQLKEIKMRYGRIMENGKQALNRVDMLTRELERKRAMVTKKDNKIQEHYEAWDEYCLFSDPSYGFPLMTRQEYEEMEYADAVAEQEAEIYAENAWLRKAEQGVDDGFEQWERSRGCY